jgi:putative FmdB family regulatory protein
MRILFDFHCSKCDLTFEELVKQEDRESTCPSCKGPATRQVSTPTIDPNFMVFDKSDHRPAIDKWDKKRRRKMAQEHKHSAFQQK